MKRLTYIISLSLVSFLTFADDEDAGGDDEGNDEDGGDGSSEGNGESEEDGGILRRLTQVK